MAMMSTLVRWREEFESLFQTLQDWPWRDTLRTLRQRFREDRLSLTASSLTFTTLIALVPLVTVMLAIFSAFPIFASFEGALQQFFLQNLVPPDIATPVLGALTQFAAQASRLGALGLAVLVITALALVLTIDRALNAIWRVRQSRPLAQRVLVYWAALTLGPLVAGVSLTITSYAISASQGLVGNLPGGVAVLLGVLEFMLLAGLIAGLFHHVPNTDVRWRHALAGGVFVATGFEATKRALGWYLSAVPTYSAIYGAFATLPIFLIWIYAGWLVVLLGAVIAAYAPSLQMKVARMPSSAGYRFTLALLVLRELTQARQGDRRGVAMLDLAAALRVDPLQIEPIVEQLQQLDWVARLDEAGEQRLVMLCEPVATKAAPLLDALLLQPSDAAAPFREHAAFENLTLAQALAR
jgi:membrane protein